MSRIQRLVRPRKHALSWKLALPILGLSAACMTVFAQGNAAPAGSWSEEKTQVSVRAAQGTHYAVVTENDESIQFTGHYDEIKGVNALRKELDGSFVWFRRDGQTYVIRDPAVVARVQQAWAPTKPVGEKMEVLGDRMEEHGKKMEALGDRMEAQAKQGEPISARMEALGREIETLGRTMHDTTETMVRTRDSAERARLETELDRLSGRMNALSDQMTSLGTELERVHAPMQTLGEEMEVAGKPMEDLGAQMEALGKDMETLSDAANQQTLTLIDQALRDGKAEVIARL